MRAYAHWLRALNSTPVSWTSVSAPATVPVSSTAPAAEVCAVALSMSRGGPGSVITDPRVEKAVGDVGQQIEDDDHRGDNHQPRHDRIGVVGEEGVDEVEAHS